jgi:hypothetical protein
MSTLYIKTLLVSLALQFIFASGELTANSVSYNTLETNGYDLSNPDVQIKLAFVHTLLLQTRQKHSHQLNGETDNQYFIRKTDGAEAVFDKHGKLVTHCVNKSVVNQENPLKRPLAHFSLDILLWLKHGKCDVQATSATQRVDAYIRDLRDSLILTVTNGSGFYLPENPNVMTKNVKGFYLFVTQLERRGFKVKSFMQYGIEEIEQRELFLATIRNVLLSELAGMNS